MGLMKTTGHATEVTIHGVKCRVVRGTVGENAYGQRSARPEIKVYAAGFGLVSSGNCTVSGAIESAARTIALRSAA
jgi:monoamine oxidase